MLRVMPIVLVALVMMGGSIFAYSVDTSLTNPSGSIGLENNVSKIWGTVLTIMRILAVAAIVFAGVKYMFASAESKADIKGGLIGLVIGAILVFGATFLVEIISNTASELS